MAELALNRVVNHAVVPLPGTYQIDPVHTFVGFRAQHLVVGRVGGRFDGVSGSATIAEDVLASTLAVSIESASIHTMLPMRDEDLRSSRYLDVDNHPAMTFRSTGISEMPAGRWSVAGQLTVRGITRPIELVVRFGGAVADPFGNERLAFEARGSISRRDFELTHELEKESGGLTIVRDVDISVDAELIRPI